MKKLMLALLMVGVLMVPQVSSARFAETLAPEMFVSMASYFSHIELSEMQEDPSTDDGLWTDWNGHGPLFIGVSFPQPSVAPSGTQGIRARVRKTQNGGQTVVVKFELWQLDYLPNGTYNFKLADLDSDIVVDDSNGQVIGTNFDASLISGLTDPTVSRWWVKIVQTSGANLGQQKNGRSFDVGSFAYDAN